MPYRAVPCQDLTERAEAGRISLGVIDERYAAKTFRSKMAPAGFLPPHRREPGLILGRTLKDQEEAAGEIFKTSRTDGPPDCYADGTKPDGQLSRGSVST